MKDNDKGPMGTQLTVKKKAEVKRKRRIVMPSGLPPMQEGQYYEHYPRAEIVLDGEEVDRGTVVYKGEEYKVLCHGKSCALIHFKGRDRWFPYDHFEEVSNERSD